MAAAVICRGDSVKGAATCRKVCEECGEKLPKMKKRFCSVDCRNKRKRRLEASEYPRMKVERTGKCCLCGEKVRAPYSAYCEVCAVDRFQKYTKRGKLK